MLVNLGSIHLQMSMFLNSETMQGLYPKKLNWNITVDAMEQLLVKD